MRIVSGFTVFADVWINFIAIVNVIPSILWANLSLFENKINIQYPHAGPGAHILCQICVKFNLQYHYVKWYKVQAPKFRRSAWFWPTSDKVLDPPLHNTRYKRYLNMKITKSIKLMILNRNFVKLDSND